MAGDGVKEFLLKVFIAMTGLVLGIAAVIMAVGLLGVFAT
jgi:hypothetical protein